MTSIDPRSARREALIAFALSTAMVAALFQLARAVPFVANNLQALVAAVFLYLPVMFAWRAGRDLAVYGFTARPLGRSLAFALGAFAVILPAFAIGFVAFYQVACSDRALAASFVPPGWCKHFLAWGGFARPRLPEELGSLALTHFFVVALPEELFYRGYLLERLEEACPPRRRVLGGGVGWALVLSALLFAVTHVLADFDPRRLATFFPGLLFGWMRSATRSILAGTLVHAGSNLYAQLLQRTFFG